MLCHKGIPLVTQHVLYIGYIAYVQYSAIAAAVVGHMTMTNYYYYYYANGEVRC